MRICPTQSGWWCTAAGARVHSFLFKARLYLIRSAFLVNEASGLSYKLIRTDIRVGSGTLRTLGQRCLDAVHRTEQTEVAFMSTAHSMPNET